MGTQIGYPIMETKGYIRKIPARSKISVRFLKKHHKKIKVGGKYPLNDKTITP